MGQMADKVSHYFKNPEELNNILSEAFNKATLETENKSIKRLLEMLATATRMVRASISGEYENLSKPKLLLMVGALIYFVLPQDLIPDKIPVIGVVDDLAVLAFFIKTASDEIAKFEEWEKTHVSALS